MNSLHIEINTQRKQTKHNNYITIPNIILLNSTFRPLFLTKT
jgi:hypothetical protein